MSLLRLRPVLNATATVRARRGAQRLLGRRSKAKESIQELKLPKMESDDIHVYI